MIYNPIEEEKKMKMMIMIITNKKTIKMKFDLNIKINKIYMHLFIFKKSNTSLYSYIKTTVDVHEFQ